MFSDKDSESRSQLSTARLPSLMALRSFEAAARLESFSRAAAELHITHGAVSRAVRLLEDELGVLLFERRSQRVFLTNAGRILSRGVSEGLQIMKNAVGDLRESLAKQHRLMLSCEPTLLMRWLLPRWPAFKAGYPSLDMQLAAGGGPFEFNNGFDLAIRRNDFEWPESYHAEFLFTEKVGPVCSPDKISCWFDASATEPFLIQAAERLHTRTRPNAWSEWSRIVGLPDVDTEGQVFDHFYFSLQAAISGLGVAIGSWYQVCDAIDNGLLVAPLGFVEDGSGYVLLSPAPFVPGSPQTNLLNWIRNLTGQ
jgi:DNA-binding transcriptional LysR family regulator